jgi:hypothetical protein
MQQYSDMLERQGITTVWYRYHNTAWLKV